MKKLLNSAVLALTLLIALTSCKKNYSREGGPNDPRCSMPPDPGPCDAAIPRYYWDAAAKECKQFTWGGCGEYPFKTLEECKSCGCK